jgi:iron complex outermembrane receptor protein
VIIETAVTVRCEPRRATLLAAAILLLGSLFAGAIHAAEAAGSFNIAPGPLQPALNRLAELTGLQILYDPTLLQGRVTRGLTGAMSPKKALAELLANTDITFNFTADDAVALFRKSNPPSLSSTNTFERSMRPRTITISTDRTFDSTYISKVGMTATKIDESSLTVPLTSESLPQTVLRDLQANRLEDALEYVSAAEVAPNGQSALGFQLRGFPTYQYYLDGVRVSPDLHHDGFRDLANIDRIEVVKGPASLLYGRTAPGGAINVITKEPLAESHVSLAQQSGSFDHQRTEIDAGGPLTTAGALLYRFNAAYEDQHSFRELLDNHRIFLAPVVTWNSSDSTANTLYAEYLNSHDTHDSGLPIIGSRLPPVPVERSLEAGGDVHTTDFRIGLKGSHAFADGWILRHHLDARWIKSPQSPQAALSDDGLDPATCTTGRCPVDRELVSIPVSRGHTYFASMDARRDIELWGMRHSILAGLDLFEAVQDSELLVKLDPTLAIDLFAPKQTAISWASLQSPDQRAYTTVAERWGGLYFQDQVQINDSLYLLMGARVDNVSEHLDIGNATLTFPNLGVYGETHHVTALKGRGGLVWHPTAALSLYGNYSQNFGITAGLFQSGNAETQLGLPAEVAAEWETGIKFESPTGRASTTLAWFNLTKKNISSSVLEPALDFYSVSYLTHSARNEGLEADFRGEIVPGLQLLASYAYIESRIENDPGVFIGPQKGAELLGSTGNRMFGVPRNGGSALAVYHFTTGPLRRLELGFGAVVRSAREGDSANDYHLPTFVRCGSLAAYNWRAAGTNFKVQMNVDNLFNARYFESLSGTRTVMPGAPRRWMVTVRAEF